MITMEQVKQARDTYLALQRQYHQEQSTTVRMTKDEDGYRGALTCIRFLDPVKYIKKGDGLFVVTKNGLPVGELEEERGNNGNGGLMCQSFTRYPSVTEEWYSYENPEFLIERIQDKNDLHTSLAFRGKESDIPNIVCFLWINEEGWEVELGVENSQATDDEELHFLIKTKREVDWEKVQMRLGKHDFPVLPDGYVCCTRKQLQDYFERNLGIVLIQEGKEIELVYRGQA